MEEHHGDTNVFAAGVQTESAFPGQPVSAGVRPGPVQSRCLSKSATSVRRAVAAEMWPASAWISTPRLSIASLLSSAVSIVVVLIAIVSIVAPGRMYVR